MVRTSPSGLHSIYYFLVVPFTNMVQLSEDKSVINCASCVREYLVGVVAILLHVWTTWQLVSLLRKKPSCSTWNKSLFFCIFFIFRCDESEAVCNFLYRLIPMQMQLQTIHRIYASTTGSNKAAVALATRTKNAYFEYSRSQHVYTYAYFYCSV